MVTPRFPPHRGGVESHVYEVARRLARETALDVEVLTTDAGRTLPPHELVEGIEVTRVPAWPRGADLYYSPSLYRRVLQAEADLIHCQGYHTLVAPMAMIAARRGRHPYVVTLHSGGHSSWLRRAVRPMQLQMLRRLLSRAERVIAVSQFEAEFFGRSLSLPPARLVVIPNGADMPVGARSLTPAARDSRLIVAVGRLERYKGHHRLIEALPLLRERLPGVRLAIAGDGPYETHLRELAHRLHVEDAVEIRGMPRDELHALLARAGVVALLSEYESQGIAVHEALALGRRVVVLQATALAELVSLEAVAGVSPEAGPEEVARVLTEQLQAPQLTAAQIPPLPTWDDCARQLRALYGSVLGGR